MVCFRACLDLDCASDPQAQIEAQKATQEFQRSVEILRAAKETIALAEERLLEEDSRQFDSAWQEMLNHATQRVSAPRRPLPSPGGKRRKWKRKGCLAVLGDGGGAVENAQRSGAQEDGGQLQLQHQPHEAAGEEAQTLHQQVQVGLSFLPRSPSLLYVAQARSCVGRKVRWCGLMQSRCFVA